MVSRPSTRRLAATKARLRRRLNWKADLASQEAERKSIPLYPLYHYGIC